MHSWFGLSVRHEGNSTDRRRMRSLAKEISHADGDVLKTRALPRTCLLRAFAQRSIAR